MHTPPGTGAPTLSITVIMLFQVTALFVRELVRRHLVETGTAPNIAAYQSAWLGFAVLAVLLWPVLRQSRPRIASFFPRSTVSLRLLLLSVAISLCLYLANWGCALIRTAFLSHYAQPERVFIDGGLQWQCPDLRLTFLALVTMSIATPVIEEVINRGLILDTLLVRRAMFPLTQSAALFAILHRPEAIAAAFVFGLVMAMQMRYRPWLPGPIIVHACVNAMVVIDQYCLAYPTLESTLLSLAPMQLGLLGTALFLLATSLAIQLVRWTGAGKPGSPTPAAVTMRGRRVQ